MAKRRPKSQPEARRPRNLPAGQRTNTSSGKRIVTHAVGALPIINRLLKRMRLQEFLARHLPPEDNRTKVDTPRIVLLLLKNLLVSREPLYGVAEWACNFGPELFDLWPDELQHLNDDRIGRGTHRGLRRRTGRPISLEKRAHQLRAARDFEVPEDIADIFAHRRPRQFQRGGDLLVRRPH